MMRARSAPHAALRQGRVPEASYRQPYRDGQGSHHTCQASHVRCPSVVRAAAAHALGRRASLVNTNAATTTTASTPMLRTL
jgi:hypothetical protein